MAPSSHCLIHKSLEIPCVLTFHKETFQSLPHTGNHWVHKSTFDLLRSEEYSVRVKEGGWPWRSTAASWRMRTDWRGMCCPGWMSGTERREAAWAMTAQACVSCSSLPAWPSAEPLEAVSQRLWSLITRSRFPLVLNICIFCIRKVKLPYWLF